MTVQVYHAVKVGMPAHCHHIGSTAFAGSDPSFRPLVAGRTSREARVRRRHCRGLELDDPEKTASSRNSKAWSTLGDVGRLDEDGFLYLTERKSFMTISGGVNIYPQEIENHLVTHPKVADVVVVGGPHAEMGEEVIAVVQPADMTDATDAFRAELDTYARKKTRA